VSGKFCFEAKVNDDGLCRFGWSSMAGSLDLGTDRNGFGFGATGKRSNAGKFEPYGEPFAAGELMDSSTLCSTETAAQIALL
jgi:ATP-dependent RNA helicase DDX1